ncbi:hypothetical protein A5N15_08795 [Rothia kristinae]|uniref:Prephenate/arogenate dehydrogenase domain-containing protein n=1 Tax=Rothia kristinae TaxID=37923 RepID=A0A657IU68_9MICC|nr:hypothetical protein A5N15_08795 [Rothia kristinae]
MVCEHEEVAPEAVRLARGLGQDLGGIVTFLDPAEHDETVALISHVPQVMSSLLASRLRDTPLEALGLAGQGLRDTTRIAASAPGMWVQILAANAASVVRTLYGVRADLDRLIGTLEDPTADGARLDIAQLMSEGNAGVARIPRQARRLPEGLQRAHRARGRHPGADRPPCSPRSGSSA